MRNIQNSKGLEAFVKFADKASTIGVFIVAALMAFLIGLQFFK